MSADRVVAIWRSCLLPGSETFIRNQANALTQWRAAFLGAVKVDSVLSDDADTIAFADSLSGRCGYLLLRLTGGSARIRSLLAGLRPTVVHAHLGGDGWLISRTARRLGVPLIITLHGRDVTRQPHARGLRGARYRRNLRRAFDRAALVLAVSQHLRRQAIDLGADPAKVRVHYTGVPIPAEVPTGPKNWDVIFVGRFVEKKGLDDLVEALGLVADLGPKALFIGTGPLEERIRVRAAELNLDATFLGAQDPAAVHRYLVESKVFVSPSKTAADGDAEGLPTTILEAASLGLPVVSTTHSGIPEAVAHGETGLLGPEGDRTVLAGHLRTLLTDDECRRRLGLHARQRARQRFDLATQTKELERLYAECAGLSAVPAAGTRGGAPGR